MMSDPLIHVLWTGGWDSSFRVISAAHAGAQIQPYYVIDHDRPSLGAELRACARIRAALPAAVAERIRPAILHERADVPKDPATSAAFRRLCARHWMGDQYDWLARWALAHGLDGIELCIHRDDKAHAALQASVLAARLRDDAGADERAVFGRLRFPVFELRKTDMLVTATRDGWLDVLNHSWFCHQPWRGHQPCGLCNPCRYTMEEGLAHRVPLAGRIRSHIPLLKRARRIFVGC